MEKNLPKNMLAEFSRLVGTLKRRIPATERGILFSDPTRLHYCAIDQDKGKNAYKFRDMKVNWKLQTIKERIVLFKGLCVYTYIYYLYVVADVWWRNHIEVKLIAKPKKPLNVITNQKVGILKSGLPPPPKKKKTMRR